jgi:two-component system LytT family response regulator
MKMQALILDNEPSDRNTLSHLLKIHCLEFVSTIDTSTTIDNAVRLIEKNNYHIVFLDIQLHEGSGFDFIQFVPESCKVVYVSAYADFGFNALKNRAFDYLLKPLDANELKNCVEKCFKASTLKQYSYLTVKEKGINTPIKHEEILLIKANGAYADIHTTNGNIFTTSKTLKALHPNLNLNFIRVHKSYIVNKHFIKGYNQKQLFLEHNNTVNISRDGLLLLQKIYSE